MSLELTRQGSKLPSVAASRTALPTGATSCWLFSAPVDLAAFLGSALLALAALALGARLGILHSTTPEWTWIIAVMLVDVAHVHATAFRVYFDPAEIRRRPLLYTLIPVGGYTLGVTLYSEGELIFWRALAYLAVFHFVRQQYGWVALYRRKCGETERLGWWIDALAIYASTIYPLLYWHAHLPRQFQWFVPQDFQSMPGGLAAAAFPAYIALLAAYFGRGLYRGVREGFWNPGKDVVVATTALCWYVGIVWFNSDYAFTVTNVLIHGIPYFVLVYWYRFERPSGNLPPDSVSPGRRAARIAGFIGLLWILAFVEELLWDRSIWHERPWLFGAGHDAGGARMFLVPLLALPQLTHYILDGFIWKRRSNPDLHTLDLPQPQK